MNKLFTIKIIITFLLTLPFQLSPMDKDQHKLKGIPNIHTYHLEKYGINNANVSITQNANGILFIGNSNGIIQYNGHHWNITETKGTPYLTRHEDSIFVATYNKWGYLQNNKYKPVIKINKNLTTSLQDSLGQTQQLISTPSGVYISANDKLFAVDDSSVRSIPIKAEIQCLHGHDSSIYAYNKNSGLLKLNPPSADFKKIKSPKALPGHITSMASYGDSILIGFKKNKRLGILYKDELFPYKTITDSLFAQSVISDIKIMEDKKIIGTKSDGIFIVENDTTFLHLKEQHGLFDGKVNKLFIDRNNNLWVLHDGGLSRVDISSGLLYYNYPGGIQGRINGIKEYHNKLYLTRSKGVNYIENYRSNATNSIKNVNVEGINTNSYNLHEFNGSLMASTENGIYKIQEDSAFLFYNKFQEHFTDVIRYKKNPNLIIIAKENGISLVKYINDLFIYQGDIEDIKYPVNSLAEDKNGRIWASTKDHGLYIIENPDTNIKHINTDYNPLDTINNKIQWKKLYSTSRALYLSTSAGLFTVNAKDKALTRDTIIPEKYSDQWVFPILEDNFKKIWFNIISTDKIFSELFIYSLKNKEKQILKLPWNKTKKFTINTIQPINDEIVWVGGTDGLIKIATDKLKERNSTFNLILHKVIANNDSILDYNIYNPEYEEKKILPFEQNTIKFEFSSTSYNEESDIRYRFLLKGYDKQWGKLTHQHFKEYKNLKEGKYVFILVAEDVYSNSTQRIEYPFEVKPPIYRTWYAFIIYIISIGLVFLLIFKWRAYYFAKEKFKLENIINERTEEVIQQKEKTDKLIERMLPKETVKELKTSRKAGPYHYNMVTVLFGDFKGFTKITENLESLNAMNLLDKLDRYFLEFDSIVEKYNIEKIKTIGDAYMCAGGIPEENQTNPIEVIIAALEMQYYMKKMKETIDNVRDIWNLRIGIDTGPVIAGVIGRSKVTYDIWGTTVNMASRMEASGEPGEINITGNTFILIKDFFICKYRGKMPVKNRGNVDMYFVENFKPQFAQSLKELKPNHEFQIQLQLLRFNDLENIILNKLEKGLPDTLFYHNVKHTIDVVTQTEIIGKSENITDEELLILKTAALFHDAGHMISYDNHEEESIKMVNKMLPHYNYSRKQIQQIEELILATKMPPEPKNHLEKIICDADLDYLGRSDFIPVAYSLYKELKANNKISSFKEWKKMEIDFIEKHAYFTETAKNLREVKKQKQLTKIVKEMTPAEHNNKPLNP
ncbi:MAG: adenylate/guanylate cyclase domain-containing protein [Bacteroidales bacterium]